MLAGFNVAGGCRCGGGCLRMLRRGVTEVAGAGECRCGGACSRMLEKCRGVAKTQKPCSC